MGVKVKFRPSSLKMKEGSIIFQVIHDNAIRHIPSGYKIYPTEWNGSLSCIVIPESADHDRKAYLTKLIKDITEGLTGFEKAFSSLRQLGKSYTVDQIVELHSKPAAIYHFLAFGRWLVSDIKLASKRRTIETYQSALNSFERFLKETNHGFMDEMNSELVSEYENWLKKNGICLNSTSFYMRNLRAIYNQAVTKGILEQQEPFNAVYTGTKETVRYAVPLETIRKIRDLDLSHDPGLDFARDIFMFSFYTRGMSFVDIANLKKENLENGFLTYHPREASKILSIKWEKPMQDIVAKYAKHKTSFLLPLINEPVKDNRKQYISALHYINKKLKEIGRMLKLNTPLRTNIARHAWALTAKNMNIPVICEALGQNSENTTLSYLATIETSQSDKANKNILASL